MYILCILIKIIIKIITIHSTQARLLRGNEATLPVNSGGLGLRSASNLAPSVFLASANGVSDLMHQLLTGTWSSLHGWCLACGHTPSYGHKSWDQPIVHQLFDSLLAHCTDQFSQSHLLGACSSESGAWLNAPPVSSLGLCMCDDAVRTAIGLRVGAPICLPHTCNLCGKSTDEFGHIGLSYRSSQWRASRHQMLNVIHRSLASDGNRSDEVTMVPQSNGKFLVLDATCMDTFCDSYRQASAKEAGVAAVHAETEKAKKYSHLDQAYQFQPIAMAT